MIRCTMDMTVPEDSKCAKCCIYCDEKEQCEYCCPNLIKWKTEEEIESNCDETC